MNIRQYLRIKTAAFNWMSNADSPENTLSDDSDLVKNLDKAENNTYNPLVEGPIYQDVNPIYQEPKKYGIPEEVAMVERERYDNQVADWRKEYQDKAMPYILSSMGVYDKTPSVSQLTSDLLNMHYSGTPTTVAPATPKADDDEFLGMDMFAAGFKRMATAPPEIQMQYKNLMDMRGKLLLRLSTHNDPVLQDKINNARYRIERQLVGLINKVRKGV